jgi:hypothetical protein
MDFLKDLAFGAQPLSIMQLIVGQGLLALREE